MCCENFFLFLENVGHFFLESKKFLFILVFHCLFHCTNVFFCLFLLLSFGFVFYLNFFSDLVFTFLFFQLLRLLICRILIVHHIFLYRCWSNSLFLLFFGLLFLRLLLFRHHIRVILIRVWFWRGFVLRNRSFLFRLLWLFIFLYIFAWVYFLNVLEWKVPFKFLISIFSVIFFNHFVVHFVQLWIILESVCISQSVQTMVGWWTSRWNTSYHHNFWFVCLWDKRISQNQC